MQLRAILAPCALPNLHPLVFAVVLSVVPLVLGQAALRCLISARRDAAPVRSIAPDGFAQDDPPGEVEPGVRAEAGLRSVSLVLTP